MLLVKELIYVAVSVTNGCPYCIAAHTVSARGKGMTDAMFHELMSVVGMANETNRLVNGYQIEIDEAFKDAGEMKLSAISRQPSAISCEPSAVGRNCVRRSVAWNDESVT